jgi:hypothetical protein
MDDLELARILRAARARSAPPPTSTGSRAFMGRVTTTTPAVGKFMNVIPQAVLGTEVEGGSATITDLGSTPSPVYLVGPGVPATGDQVIASWSDWRWVARKRGTGGSVCYTIRRGCHDAYGVIEPLSGISISVVQGGVTIYTCTTDATGSCPCFTLASLDPITTTLSATGFDTLTFTLTPSLGTNSIIRALYPTGLTSAMPCCGDPDPSPIPATSIHLSYQVNPSTRETITLTRDGPSYCSYSGNGVLTLGTWRVIYNGGNSWTVTAGYIGEPYASANFTSPPDTPSATISSLTYVGGGTVTYHSPVVITL